MVYSSGTGPACSACPGESPRGWPHAENKKCFGGVRTDGSLWASLLGPI